MSKSIQVITYDKRRRFILNYFNANNPCVDCLDADFVVSYILATKARFRQINYGAHKCSSLQRDLKRMQNEGSLKRHRVGISDLAGMGFPKWVWVYEPS